MIYKLNKIYSIYKKFPVSLYDNNLVEFINLNITCNTQQFNIDFHSSTFNKLIRKEFKYDYPSYVKFQHILTKEELSRLKSEDLLLPYETYMDKVIANRSPERQKQVYKNLQTEIVSNQGHRLRHGINNIKARIEALKVRLSKY